MKLLERGSSQRVTRIDQGRQGRQAVCHVVGIFEALRGDPRPYRRGLIFTWVLGCKAKLPQSQPGQGAAATGQRCAGIRAILAMGFERPFPVCLQIYRKLLAHGFTYRVNVLRVNRLQLFGQIGFRWKREHQFFERRVQLRMSQHGTQCRNDVVADAMGGCRACFTLQRFEGAIHQQSLAGFPTIEGVAVMGQQMDQLLIRIVKSQNHRRRETAQQGGHRL